MDMKKQLKRKTDVYKRVSKELQSYEKEVAREQAKVDKMKAEGADPFDIKQQENVLAESQMMIPDCRKRLTKALQDLESLLSEAEEDPSVVGTEELTNAKSIVDAAETITVAC
eukprot:TRINITY_DN9183_c0_g1_i10.p1 TRINITY_DN9183_c0_g1~~TRINITY_DN9183_c0_g1_i10.p1  ORF type:complete len:113 (-),score=33.46 TRINITY_DN9183_c0_g1_i10:872-1210(-)